jgi:hypothetical protein
VSRDAGEFAFCRDESEAHDVGRRRGAFRVGCLGLAVYVHVCVTYKRFVSVRVCANL